MKCRTRTTPMPARCSRLGSRRRRRETEPSFKRKDAEALLRDGDRSASVCAFESRRVRPLAVECHRKTRFYVTVRLIHGDMREKLAELADASVDAIVTDPPYHLTTGKKGGSGPASVNLESPYGRARVGTRFIGMTWDGGDIAMQPATWALLLRVAKPGAHLLVFSSSRTFHRVWCAVEDAGWEIRDTLMWLHGEGLPKSSNQHGEWEGWGTALKPAFEPILMARKPLIGTVAENLQAHRGGALNIDACRVDGAVGSGVWGSSNKTVRPE